MKKILSLSLVLVIILSIRVTAFATDKADVVSTAETANEVLPSHKLTTYADADYFQRAMSEKK